MLRLLADENLHPAIFQGVRQSRPDVDFVRVQDVGLRGWDDSQILEWAALQGRLVVTHDVRTMTSFAFERVASGLPMPGVLEIHPSLPFRSAINELVFIAVCSDEGEWEGQVVFLPI